MTKSNKRIETAKCRLTVKVGKRELVRNIELRYLISHFIKEPELMFEKGWKVTIT